ncbi:MAG TPA: DNA polymerase III subunit epsilon [Gammaproteobacteria bacterium]
MRQVVLDTESTGLEVSQGHRLIEIGCIELDDRRPTGRTFHAYLCPDREVEAGALAMHGITNEFLSSQRRFADVARELLEFLRGAELIIHNAEFDVGFLNAELARLADDDVRLEDCCSVLDTLALARQMHPGQRNSLDALCRRYGVDNSQREQHGALLDAELLLKVYLAMTGGQGALTFEHDTPGLNVDGAPNGRAERGGAHIPVLRPTAAEAAAHERALEAVARASGGRVLFRDARR